MKLVQPQTDMPCWLVRARGREQRIDCSKFLLLSFSLPEDFFLLYARSKEVGEEDKRSRASSNEEHWKWWMAVEVNK